MLNVAKFKLTGVAPLLMSNGRKADPMWFRTKALKELTQQKKKTEELQMQIRELEWYAGLYEVDGVVVLPSDMILSGIIGGAKKHKNGNEAKAGVFETDPFFPLQYAGPKKDLAALYADGRFVDCRGVAQNMKRIMRTRPIFRDWSVEVSVSFDDEVIEQLTIKQALDQCGMLIGFGDFRPRYGRFTVETL
jgi:hypothetical protein